MAFVGEGPMEPIIPVPVYSQFYSPGITCTDGKCTSVVTGESVIDPRGVAIGAVAGVVAGAVAGPAVGIGAAILAWLATPALAPKTKPKPETH